MTKLYLKTSNYIGTGANSLNVFPRSLDLNDTISYKGHPNEDWPSEVEIAAISKYGEKYICIELAKNLGKTAIVFVDDIPIPPSLIGKPSND